MWWLLMSIDISNITLLWNASSINANCKKRWKAMDWKMENVLISFFCTHECNNKKFENLSFHICGIDWVFHQHACGHEAPRRCHIGCANDWKSSLDWHTAIAAPSPYVFTYSLANSHPKLCQQETCGPDQSLWHSCVACCGIQWSHKTAQLWSL